MQSSKPRLPGASDRIVIVGRTGSGKTQAAVFHLSKQDFDVRPWIIIDYKGDDLIGGIKKAEEIGYETIPDDPGIYILRVLPGEEDELSLWFRKAWEHENLGIYIDEGYMVGQRDKWFNACLTQGRSKRITMIILSQRPLWMSRFAFSEASFIQVFGLTDADDMKVVQRFMKGDSKAGVGAELKKYHSFYYDVGANQVYTLGPVPKGGSLLATINERLPDRKRRAL